MEYGTLYLTRYLSIYMPLNMENSTSRTEKKKVLHDKITLKLHKHVHLCMLLKSPSAI